MIHRNDRSTIIPSRGRLWEATLAHFLCITLGCSQKCVAELRILLHKKGHKAVEMPEQIVADQDPAVAVRAGADTDRGNLQLGGDRLGNVVGNRSWTTVCAGIALEC